MKCYVYQSIHLLTFQTLTHCFGFLLLHKTSVFSLLVLSLMFHIFIHFLSFLFVITSFNSSKETLISTLIYVKNMKVQKIVIIGQINIIMIENDRKRGKSNPGWK